MIVDQATIDQVKDGKLRKLFLPFRRGEQGELLACPISQETVFKFWDGTPFKKGLPATAILVKKATDAEATGALTPEGTPGAEGWLVAFVVGDYVTVKDPDAPPFFARHADRYLSRGGTTTDPERHILGEPQLTSEDELAIAARARERRDLEDEQRWRAARSQMQAAISAMESAGAAPADIGFMRRRLAKMDRSRNERRAA